MVVALGFNLMLFGANLLDATSRQIALRNQMATEKASESLTILDTEITNNKLNTTAFNDGGVSIHIVRLWITNNSANPKWHGKAEVNYWLAPGKTLRGIGNITGVFDPSRTYIIDLVTDRGNIFQTIYAPSNTIVATVQGFGWLTIDWNSYQYTYSVGGGPDQGPFNGWCITQTSATFQFTLKAINHFNKPLKLMTWTYLKFVSNSGGDTPFFIMDNRSYAHTPFAYNPPPYIELPENPSDPQTGGTPTLLKFLGKTPGGTEKATFGVGDFSVLVVFFYQYTDAQGTHTLGQSVPYEATEVIASSC